MHLGGDTRAGSVRSSAKNSRNEHLSRAIIAQYARNRLPAAAITGREPAVLPTLGAAGGAPTGIGKAVGASAAGVPGEVDVLAPELTPDLAPAHP